MFDSNKAYKVIKVDDYQTHRPQGDGIEAIQVGDIVKIPNHGWATWTNSGGSWCWGVEVNNRYGAAFHTSHLQEIK